MITPEKAAELYEEFNGQGIYPGDEDILDALRTIAQMETVYPVQHRGPGAENAPFWSDRDDFLYEESARESRRQIIDRLDWPEDRIRVMRRHFMEVDITND